MAPDAQLGELTDRAVRLLGRAPARRRVLIGIAGAPGAGKTTLARRLAAAFCQLDDEVRRARLIRRHVEFGKTTEEVRDWVERLDQVNARIVAATAPAADLLIRG